MSELLVKLFIKDYQNTSNPVVREKYGLLSGFIGILVNVILTIGKFIIGTLSHSIAITGDAINNLADAGSNIVTLVGFKMAGMKPDKEHPFGHGRIEYIAALIVGFIVELMGFELIKSSIDKIRNPEPLVFSFPAVLVLVLSIFGKIWLALFNRHLGKKIDSPAMSAVVADSISDTTATTVTLICLILSRFTALPLDGYFGIAVSLFIMYSGYGILKETISVLLGTPPEKELVDEIINLVKSHEEIIGIHDLVIHSYGAGHIFASLHAEVEADVDILAAHDSIDIIEQEVMAKFGIQLVIHLDPLITNDDEINRLKAITEDAVCAVDNTLKIHDFRTVVGPTHTNLIFDVVKPFEVKLTDKEIQTMIQEKITEINPTYFIVATIEASYI